MKHVRVRIAAGGREAEIHPMYDLLANAPFVERAAALQWNFTGEALGILHYVEGDADAFVDAVEGVPEVLGYDVSRAGDDAFYAYVRDATTESLREMFGPVTSGGLVVIPPVRYRPDGSVAFSVFGPSDELGAAVEAVPDPVTVTVEEVSGLAAASVAAETALSDRQREAIVTAIELGYYDVPRTADHEEVAEQLGCAPSTAAEHLRKGESKALQSLFASLTPRQSRR